MALVQNIHEGMNLLVCVVMLQLLTVVSGVLIHNIWQRFQKKKIYVCTSPCFSPFSPLPSPISLSLIFVTDMDWRNTCMC